MRPHHTATDMNVVLLQAFLEGIVAVQCASTYRLAPCLVVVGASSSLRLNLRFLRFLLNPLDCDPVYVVPDQSSFVQSCFAARLISSIYLTYSTFETFSSVLAAYSMAHVNVFYSCVLLWIPGREI